MSGDPGIDGPLKDRKSAQRERVGVAASRLVSRAKDGSSGAAEGAEVSPHHQNWYGYQKSGPNDY